MENNISNTEGPVLKPVYIFIAFAGFLCSVASASPPRPLPEELQPAPSIAAKPPFIEGRLLNTIFGHHPRAEGGGAREYTIKDDGSILRLFRNGGFEYFDGVIEEGTWSYKDGLLKLTLNDKLFRQFEVEENWKSIVPSIDPNGWKTFAALMNIRDPQWDPDANDGLLYGHIIEDEGTKFLFYKNGDFEYFGEGVEEGTWSYKDQLLKAFLNDEILRKFKVEENGKSIALIDPRAQRGIPDQIARTRDLLEKLRDRVRELDGLRNDALTQSEVYRKQADEALAQAAVYKKESEAAIAQAEANKINAEDYKKKADAALARAEANKINADKALAAVAVAETKTSVAIAQAKANQEKADEALTTAAADVAKAAADVKEANDALAEFAEQVETINRDLFESLSPIPAVEDNETQDTETLEDKKARDAAEHEALKDAIANGGLYKNLHSNGFPKGVTNSQEIKPNRLSVPGTGVNFGDMNIGYENGKPIFTPVEEPKSTAASTVNGFLDKMKNKSAAQNERFIQEQQIAREAHQQREKERLARLRADEAKRTAVRNKLNSDYAAQQAAQRARLKMQEQEQDRRAAAQRAAQNRAVQQSQPYNRSSIPNLNRPRSIGAGPTIKRQSFTTWGW